VQLLLVQQANAASAKPLQLRLSLVFASTLACENLTRRFSHASGLYKANISALLLTQTFVQNQVYPPIPHPYEK
jgi:hypothetical protein